MAHVLKPPTPIPPAFASPTVFLAGSIEMGIAADWQGEFARHLNDLDVIILNPRRDDWDASWVQSVENAAFREQVEWELHAQERAAVIGMYFEPSTKAPITLLELGLFARSGKLIVCCPEGYWRRGNVEVVCHWYGVPLVAEPGDLVRLVRTRLTTSLGRP